MRAEILGPPGVSVGKDAVVSEVAHHSMLLDERYKIVVDRRRWRVVELYDREVDPDEWINRVDDQALLPVQRRGVEQLRAILLG